MHAHGAVRFYAKRLAPNDNKKNQIYLGANFSSLNVLPHHPIARDDSSKAGSLRYREKAKVCFYWVDEAGLSRAPNAQLILYPRYTEVRLSSLLVGSQRAPSELIGSRAEGRILFLGICNDGRILGFATPADHPASAELRTTTGLVSVGVFLDLTPLREGKVDPRSSLVRALRTVHLKNWIACQKIGPSGHPEPYGNAQNGGGYTLEAELGVAPNGFALPDFLGWEVKQFAVRDFINYRAKNVVTLMTPEPTGGYYKEKGVQAFLREFGYPDKKGRPDRINFGGTYYSGRDFHKDTRVALRILGFDAIAQKITDLDGCVALIDSKDRVAASWDIRGLMKHWNTKHALAVYVPSMHRKPPPEYRYGARVQLCEETDFLLFLSALAKGWIYYDPAIKIEGESTAKPKIKPRSQFRAAQPRVASLYRRSKNIDLLTY